MRTFLFFLISLAFTLPIQAQSQNETFVELNRQIETTPETVEREATNVAKAKQYLRTITSAPDPTVLVAGNLHLRIGDAPFVLYLRSTNHHTEARLECQKLNVSEQTVEKAKVFLREVADRATSKRG